MKKTYFLKIISVIISLAFASIAMAQTNFKKKIFSTVTLSGKITAANTGEPLDGASIYISDLKVGTVSDAAGNYIIKDIRQGTYLVQAGFIGYKDNIKKILLEKNTKQDFEMEISITEENEIVVTGTSKATTIRKNPIPIISINRQFLQQNLSTNIIDAIATVPGISAVTTGPNVSKPFIRGLGYNRILTLYDGIRQEGQQWGDEHGIEVDQNTVDKVEVVKGPASLIYGSDAVAGVINLLPPNPPPDGTSIGNISTEYQTNNGLMAASAMAAGNKNSIFWLGRSSFKMATNYRDNIDGRVYNTGFRELDFSGMAGINRSWGYSHLGFAAFDDL